MENCKELYKEGTPEYDACVEKNKSEKNTEEKSWGQQFFEWGAKKIAGGIVNKLVENQKERIDEIESAIGQDNTGPVGRAFAIRAETNKITKRRPAFKS